MTKGELIIGSNTEGFALQEGVKSGKHQDEDYCFTLTTPKRDFVMMANTENERRMWMDCLSKVISQPMTDEDKEGWSNFHVFCDRSSKVAGSSKTSILYGVISLRGH